MRCPKCHYISFESGDRCRNCGYEFSLATPDGGRPPVLDELPLNDVDAAPQAPIDLSFMNDAPSATSPPPAPRPQSERDLPLFGRANRHATDDRIIEDDDDDAPLIKPSAVPRAPLAVRRATPDTQRLRSRYTVAESPRLDLEPATAIVETESSQPQPTPANGVEDAPPARRLVAAAIDLTIVGGIDIGVLYFTLRLCALPLSAASVLELPPVPFFGFLLLVDAGYAITFTAILGQTIGKMATGLKVVNTDEALTAASHPNFGFSILRTAAYAASLLPFGLGFLPALVGGDRRALHDRLADTRVVKA